MSAYTGVENLEVMEEAVRYNRFLLGLIEPGGRLLDFGAGSGTFARKLAAQGAEVTCIEPDPALRLALEKQKLPVYAHLGEIPDKSVELVYSFNVLEHIEDDAAALRELRRVLKPGGRLLLYVPAFMLLYSAMDRRIGHVRRYTKAGLTQAVRRAGFSVDEARYADSLGFLASLAFRALGPRSGALNVRSVRFYDRYLFPLSCMLDVFLHPLIGKNLILRATKA